MPFSMRGGIQVLDGPARFPKLFVTSIDGEGVARDTQEVAHAAGFVVKAEAQLGELPLLYGRIDEADPLRSSGCIRTTPQAIWGRHIKESAALFGIEFPPRTPS